VNDVLLRFDMNAHVFSGSVLTLSIPYNIHEFLNMISLLKPSDNLGGVLRLWAVPPSEIIFLSEGSLVLSSAENVIALYLSPESSESNCELKKSGGGAYYEIAVTGFTPGIRGEAGQLFSGMAGRDYVIVLMDGNQQYQVAGTKDQPLHFSFEAKTGMAVSDRGGYTLSFKRDCTRPIAQISNPF